ncbi:MAG: hypothetical protein ABIG93_00280 [archaeon]|nr:hypothetical protein [Nanoarchaeota archaeon]
MGFFNSILKHFSSEKKEEVKEIKFNEIENWLNSWSEKNVEHTTIKLAKIKKDLTEEKIKLKENLDLLADATLKNPNIPEKAKHFMEGNRENYLLRSKIISQKTNLPEDFNEILEFCRSFDKDLDDFGKGTARSYQVMQEFFANESRAIASQIAKFDRLVKEAEQVVNSSGTETVSELRSKIQKIVSLNKQKEELGDKVKLKKDQLSESKNNLEKLRKEIKNKQEDVAYQKIIELRKEKETLSEKIKSMEDQLSLSFSVIGTALKKYERLSLDANLVNNYLENPVKSLLADSEFKVIELFDKMKNSIEKGDIDLKDKKKVKSLQEISKFTKDYLESYVLQYNKLKQNKEKLKSEIDNAKIVGEVKELKDELNQLEKDIEVTENELESTVKKLDAIDIEDLKKDFQNKFREVTGNKVVF